MDLLLQLSQVESEKSIAISGSKSVTNRLLLLQALYPNLKLENASVSDDAQVMEKALSGSDNFIDIHHAGTAMRFLTAYFAMQPDLEIVLTGSSRMQERPIGILVDALRELGAEMTYQEKEGFPPLRINGKKLTGNKVSLLANVSSQYISALLLVASKLENGLELTLEGEITSMPYIQMTLDLLHEIGIRTEFIQNRITVLPAIDNQQPTTVNVESDWSSASYYYSIIALSKPGTKITLRHFKENSWQGDSVLKEIYKQFDVETIFKDNSITLTKTQPTTIGSALIKINLNNTPDLAQTIAVTCFGLGKACHLSGLHTLKIKETDRLAALQNELQKLGANVSITQDSLTLEASSTIHSNIKIATYNDHRMAMAFVPLALKVPLVIENAGVVSKSYPNFWNDLEQIGFQVKPTE